MKTAKQQSCHHFRFFLLPHILHKSKPGSRRMYSYDEHPAKVRPLKSAVAYSMISNSMGQAKSVLPGIKAFKGFE